MFERKTKEIELFGRQLLLFERNASDVLSLADFSAKNPDTGIQIVVYKAIKIIQSSLSRNLDNCNWFEKRKLKKLLSQKHLINNLSNQQIFSIAKEVLELDGLLVEENTEKKKKEV